MGDIRILNQIAAGKSSLIANSERMIPTSVIDRLMAFSVSDGHIKTMTETKIIWRGIVASSHLAIWAAPANAGKTAIAMRAAGELAGNGFRVFYFQEDASAGDLPAMYDHAKANRYVLLNGTLTNAAPLDQIIVMRELVESGEDMSGVVLILDTLKKFADLMSKGGTREFFRLMRSLTQRGATIIALGHTNKHRGMDGKLMFEGVGDIRNDVDELIYVESTDKDERGVVTITMTPDKVRSLVAPITFTLDTTTMCLTPCERVINIQAIAKRQRQMEEDAELIAAIRKLLFNTGMSKVALAEKLMADTGIGKRKALAVIDRYSTRDVQDENALWLETPMRMNNTMHISLPK